jgi:hypothetical protein
MEMTFATAASAGPAGRGAADKSGLEAPVRGRLIACRDCDLLQTVGSGGQHARAMIAFESPPDSEQA